MEDLKIELYTLHENRAHLGDNFIEINNTVEQLTLSCCGGR